jgi:hypothetical protein
MKTSVKEVSVKKIKKKFERSRKYREWRLKYEAELNRNRFLQAAEAKRRVHSLLFEDEPELPKNGILLRKKRN